MIGLDTTIIDGPFAPSTYPIYTHIKMKTSKSKMRL